MKILITGYKGFIGQHMLDALKDKHEVKTFEWGETFPSIGGLDWCIHLGAITSTTEKDVDKVLTQNYDFSCRLLDKCLTYNVNFQYASSAAVYGNATSEFREDSKVNPVSPYAWSKYLFERYAEYNLPRAKHIKLKVQGFRYFNVYGPQYEDHKFGQSSPHFSFMKQAQSSGVINLFEGSENFKRDFVPVCTVVDTHEKFFKVEESGIWNIGTGQSTSFETVAKNIAHKYRARIEYIPMPETIKSQYQSYTCADITKLNRTLYEKNIC